MPRPALAAALALASLIGLGVTMLAQPYFIEDAHRVGSGHLQTYLRERANTERALFDDVAQSHAAAAAQYQRIYTALDADSAGRHFRDAFPVHHSGVRRSDPALFDGGLDASGVFTYGLGAFIGAVDPSPAKTRALAAALLTVRSAGPAHAGRFDNFYFNDDRNNLVIFAPDREDRLMYYREDAPAEFDFSHQPFVQIALPGANPLGRTRCTHLTDRIDQQAQRALTIGCHTPVRIAGVHLGAFGVTLDVQNYLTESLAGAPDHADNMILTREGEVVAHRALFAREVITDADVARVREQIDVTGIADAVIATGQSTGVIPDPSGDGLIGFVKLDAPGWIFVTRQALPGALISSWIKAISLGLIAAVLIGAQFQMLAGRAAARRRRRAPA